MRHDLAYCNIYAFILHSSWNRLSISMYHAVLIYRPIYSLRSRNQFTIPGLSDLQIWIRICDRKDFQVREDLEIYQRSKHYCDSFIRSVEKKIVKDKILMDWLFNLSSRDSKNLKSFSVERLLRKKTWIDYCMRIKKKKKTNFSE